MSRYIKKAENKTIFKLKDIVENEKSYIPELVIAAIDELEKRQGISKEIKKEYLLKEEIKTKKIIDRKIEKGPFIPKSIPQSIITAAVLVYVSGVLSFATGVIYFTDTINLNGILILALGLMIHKGKEVWKWVLAVLAGLGLLLILISLVYSLVNRFSFSFSSLGVVHTIIQVSAVVMLFRSDSQKWYKAQKGEQVDEDEFIFLD